MKICQAEKVSGIRARSSWYIGTPRSAGPVSSVGRVQSPSPGPSGLPNGDLMSGIFMTPVGQNIALFQRTFSRRLRVEFVRTTGRDQAGKLQASGLDSSKAGPSRANWIMSLLMARKERVRKKLRIASRTSNSLVVPLEGMDHPCHGEHLVLLQRSTCPAKVHKEFGGVPGRSGP